MSSTIVDHSADESSTSPTRPSNASPLSAKESRKYGSAGEGLGRRALKELARKHGLRPRRRLGQHFLADPNLARRIVEFSGVGPGENVLEIGAGLGSLTIPLAETGARVLAVELDARLLPAFQEAVGGYENVTILAADALLVEWEEVLAGGKWKMASNLPYNVAAPLVIGMLERGLPIDSYLAMVQREVGERLSAGPDDKAYGAASVHVSYWAEAKVLRRVPRTVFWPEPRVDSVLLRLEPRAEPPVGVGAESLFRVVDEGFRQRRKTMKNALRRLGLEPSKASEILVSAGVPADVRAEDLGLEDFARVAEYVDEAVGD